MQFRHNVSQGVQRVQAPNSPLTELTLISLLISMGDYDLFRNFCQEKGFALASLVVTCGYDGFMSGVSREHAK